jgi:hypothetical protein
MVVVPRRTSEEYEMTTTLQDLLAVDDGAGVLTITASFDPTGLAAGGPTAPAEVRAALRGLVADGDGDGDRARALRARLGHLDERLDDFLDPRGSGRGRLLVVGLGEGEVSEHRFQVPLPTEVHLAAGPVLRRVLEVVDEHQPAGVVLLHASEALVLEVELGSHVPVASYGVELGDEVFADEFYGPSPSNSFHRGISNREARQDRVQANLDRFLDEVADGVQVAAEDHGWARVVLVGPARERGVVGDALAGASGLGVLHVDSVAAGPPRDVLDRVREVLEDDHRDHEVELVTTAIDRALSEGGAGAVGVVDVARALTQGRVHHLLLSPSFEAEGLRGRDGVLVAADDHDRTDDGLAPEPRFVHRMIVRALDTDAHVTPVDGDAAARLDEQGRVAALLRW